MSEPAIKYDTGREQPNDRIDHYLQLLSQPQFQSHAVIAELLARKDEHIATYLRNSGRKSHEIAHLKAKLARIEFLEPILKSVLLARDGSTTIDLNDLGTLKDFRITIDGKAIETFLSASDVETQDSEIRVAIEHPDEAQFEC